MSEFELLVLPLSLVLGLGVTRMLSGLIHIVRLREGGSLHWLPMAWSFFVLGYIIQFFNYLYDVGLEHDAWDWRQYGPSLLQSLLLFASAGVIFPSESSTEPPDMLADFGKHGRLALVPLGVYLAQAPLTNVLVGGSAWIDLGNLLPVLGTGLIVVAYFAQRSRLRTISTLAFGVVSMVGWFVVWSQPGDG